MNRPNPLTIYPDIDLKLGIKSSFLILEVL